MSNEELLSAVQTVVETAIQPLKEAMALQDEKIDRLESQLEQVHEKLDNKIDLVSEKLDNKIDQVHEKLDNKIDQVHEKLDSKIDQVHEKLNNKIDQVHEELDGKIDLVYEKLDDKIDLVFEAAKDVSRDLKVVKKTVKKLETEQNETELRSIQASVDASKALSRTVAFEKRLNAYDETLEALKKYLPPTP